MYASHADPCWERLKNGEKQALEELYVQYANMLYNYGRHICKDGNLVRDCIQDLFIELWQKHSTISSTTSVKFYLYSSLRRKVIYEVKKNNRQLCSHEISEDVEVENLFELVDVKNLLAANNRTKLQNLIDTLPPRQKEALMLIFFDNLSRDEVAGIMGVSTESIYSITWRAIRSLRKKVQDEKPAIYFTTFSLTVFVTMILLFC